MAVTITTFDDWVAAFRAWQDDIGLDHHHVAGLRHPVTFRFRGLRKDGSTFAAETDMIPLCWRGHPIAYHFVRELPGTD